MKRLSLLLNLILIVVVLILYFNPKISSKNINSDSNQDNLNLDELSQKYPFLAKRIVLENELDLLVNFMPLRKNLKDLVAPFGDSFAFYFEYLPTGISIGVNEKSDFNPASLGKVPLAMAFYSDSENGGEKIDKKVKIKPEHIDQASGNLWQRGAGAEISFEEAITLMLQESDNTAARLLADYVPADDYKQVYSKLDVDFPADNNNLITAKGYSSILKALYFASILNKDDSEKLLSLLAKTKFSDKLVAGLPKDIKVAHKIGFWGEALYSDCGIVYLPQRSYLLCMVSKTSEEEARNRMKTLSEIVYKYVSTINPN